MELVLIRFNYVFFSDVFIITKGIKRRSENVIKNKSQETDNCTKAIVSEI